MTGHFSKEALEAVQEIFAEGQKNPYEGKCGQRKLREQDKKPRSPEQIEGDRERAAALQGRPQAGANRSAAAKKAAETRKRCKGGGGETPKPFTI
jgi:hypothetical protein